MMMSRLLACLSICAVATAAGAFTPATWDVLVRRSTDRFPRLPQVVGAVDIAAVCGGGVTGPVVYCTSENVIYEGFDDRSDPAALYLIAHLLGHGLQVQYGIADIALAAIRAEPEREAELRGMVERQNDCLAGMLIARAGMPMPDIARLFVDDPLQAAHWGRTPVRNGPQLFVPLEVRAHWLETGYDAARPGACEVGGISAELIVAADRAPG